MWTCVVVDERLVEVEYKLLALPQCKFHGWKQWTFLAVDEQKVH